VFLVRFPSPFRHVLTVLRLTFHGCN
jgi:hypothetical protein